MKVTVCITKKRTFATKNLTKDKLMDRAFLFI